AFGLILPLDAWVGLGTPSSPLAGMPLPDGGQLLRIARPGAVRLARATGSGVGEDAVELRAAARIGEVGLAEPDGRGAGWIVIHLWRELPSAADQYEVVHVEGTRVLTSFAVADLAYTDTPPPSRFRIGADGALYQLVSSTEGIRIVRFDLKEER